MVGSEAVLGTSKVDPRFRITLVQPVPEILGAKAGDLIIFVQDKDGEVKIKVSSIPLNQKKKMRK